MSTQVQESAADARRSAQREALLDAASEMLVHGGPDAISLRKLAARVGTSTMAVYTAFGGKDGLIAALFMEAFDRLANDATRDSITPRNLTSGVPFHVVDRPDLYDAETVAAVARVVETYLARSADFRSPALLDCRDFGA